MTSVVLHMCDELNIYVMLRTHSFVQFDFKCGLYFLFMMLVFVPNVNINYSNRLLLNYFYSEIEYL